MTSEKTIPSSNSDLERMIERYHRELRNLGQRAPAPASPPSLLDQAPEPIRESPPSLPVEENGTGAPANTEDTLADALTPPFPAPYTDSGGLFVTATTARESLPVADADVFLSAVINGKRILHAFLRTDENGKTPLISLPAPSRALSEEPGDPAPYALYDVLVDHPDYYVEVRKNVQVFGGVLSNLPVNLIPAAVPVYPSNPSNLTVLESTQVSDTDRSEQTKKG